MKKLKKREKSVLALRPPRTQATPLRQAHAHLDPRLAWLSELQRWRFVRFHEVRSHGCFLPLFVLN